MFCEFQIFSLYGTGGMGLRRRKMIKTSKKTFPPGPSKTCWGFWPTFLKSFRYGWILYAERIFCRVSFSLHRSWNKTTVLQQDCFFPYPTSRIRLWENKGCVVKKPCLQCLTCWRSFSGSRGIAKIAMKSQYICSRVNQLWHDFFAN